MLISEIRVMRGPNMWSREHQHLIVVKFNFLPAVEMIQSNSALIRKYFNEVHGLPGTDDDLLYFFAQAIVKIASELEGKENNYYSVHVPAKNTYYGVFGYETEEAGKAALDMGVAIAESVMMNELPIPLPLAKEKVKKVVEAFAPGPSTRAILKEAKKQSIAVKEAPGGYYTLGYGKYQQKISASIVHSTAAIGVDIAGDKEYTKAFLERMMIPVPEGKVVTDEAELESVAQLLGFPLVTKPLDGNQGKCITGNIYEIKDLREGFNKAQERSQQVIVEKQIQGKDYRVLVINYKFIAAAVRFPAYVTGNGFSSIEELVHAENNNPRRGEGHERPLTKIRIDDNTNAILEKQGLKPASVPKQGQRVYLKTTANISTGGVAEDVTAEVHPDNIAMFEKIARVIGLDVCGIDAMAHDLWQPLAQSGGAVLEVNAAPGLRMHLDPDKGIPRNVGKPIIDMMFPKDLPTAIPIVAVTGTNGKTTTTRLIAHLAKTTGLYTGFTTTDGIYKDGCRIKTGDCSGPMSAEVILHDPTMEFAVLECARGGIIRSGLGFAACDIGIVTNVAEDHLGLKDINTLEDLANVKAVVPRAVKQNGWAILNAADDLVYQMSRGLDCNVALFCLDENNERIQAHCRNGGTAAVTDKYGNIVIVKGTGRMIVENIMNVPLTMEGKAPFMTENVLPATLALFLLNIPRNRIAEGLRSFIVSPDHTPGRLNRFTINGVNILVDYAHNPHGLRALAGYLANIDQKKTGIITGTGDRRDEDIIELGRVAALMYDDVIIRIDRDTRGRSAESIIHFLVKGLEQEKPGISHRVIPDTEEALKFCIENNNPGSYTVISADDALETIAITSKLKDLYPDKEIHNDSLVNEGGIKEPNKN